MIFGGRLCVLVEQLDARFERLRRVFEQLDANFERSRRAFERLGADFERSRRAFEQLDVDFERSRRAFEQLDSFFEQPARLMANAFDSEVCRSAQVDILCLRIRLYENHPINLLRRFTSVRVLSTSSTN